MRDPVGLPVTRRLLWAAIAAVGVATLVLVAVMVKN